MNEYLFIIRGGMEGQPSPEEMQTEMEKWRVWMGGLAEKGILVGGQPLENPGKTLIENGTKVIDRPLVEGKELIGGYIIVKADSLEEGTELAKGCPGFDHGCTIEVRQIASMG